MDKQERVTAVYPAMAGEGSGLFSIEERHITGAGLPPEDLVQAIGAHIVEATFGEARFSDDQVSVRLSLLLFRSGIDPADLVTLRFTLVVPTPFGSVEIDMDIARAEANVIPVPPGTVTKAPRTILWLKPRDGVKEDDHKELFSSLLADARCSRSEWFQLVERLIIRHPGSEKARFELVNESYRPPQPLSLEQAAAGIRAMQEMDELSIVFIDEPTPLPNRGTDLGLPIVVFEGKR